MCLLSRFVELVNESEVAFNVGDEIEKGSGLWRKYFVFNMADLRVGDLVCGWLNR